MKNKKGFTLVELLAVIVILGVLLLIAVPAITNVQRRAKINSLKDGALLLAKSYENYETLKDADDEFGSDYYEGTVCPTSGTKANCGEVSYSGGTYSLSFYLDDYSLTVTGSTLADVKTNINALTVESFNGGKTYPTS